MQRMSTLYCMTPVSFGKNFNIQLHSINSRIIQRFLLDTSHARFNFLKVTISPTAKIRTLALTKTALIFKSGEIRGVPNETQGDISQVDDEDELCPVECVREFNTDDELFSILAKAKETGALVVVDFYRTACGSCKYIEQGFKKLCKGSGEQNSPVIFLKHNVIDEYDEQSEVAERLRIKAVPLFHFYKNGVMLESFATRDKARIDAAIHKYTSPPS